MIERVPNPPVQAPRDLKAEKIAELEYIISVWQERYKRTSDELAQAAAEKSSLVAEIVALKDGLRLQADAYRSLYAKHQRATSQLHDTEQVAAANAKENERLKELFADADRIIIELHRQLDGERQGLAQLRASRDEDIQAALDKAIEAIRNSRITP